MQAIETAAKAIEEARGLVIAAGAGMGVDSGLPDFRGPEGFWRAYPAYQKLRLRFEELANPRWFRADPELAWGFYGHRLGLYRATRPHEGFRILLELARSKAAGFFAVTSNVDGQFQEAGFPSDRVLEVHGTIHQNQCLNACGAGVFPAAAVQVETATMRARPPLPSCPKCAGLARPNILMFQDADWEGSSSEAMGESFRRWLRGTPSDSLAVIELGAGNAVPTLRHLSESLVRAFGARLVRINPTDTGVPQGEVSLPLGAREGLRQIATLLG